MQNNLNSKKYKIFATAHQIDTILVYKHNLLKMHLIFACTVRHEIKLYSHRKWKKVSIQFSTVFQSIIVD